MRLPLRHPLDDFVTVLSLNLCKPPGPKTGATMSLKIGVSSTTGTSSLTLRGKPDSFRLDLAVTDALFVVVVPLRSLSGAVATEAFFACLVVDADE
jgi:hypothetical protein